MQSFQDQFLGYVQTQQLFGQNDSILVALSGGVDSIVLLHLLLNVQKQLHLTITAAHLNHQLRGNEADGDEEFVRRFCEKFAVPLVIEKRDVPAWCREHKVSIETGARECRYQFLQQTATRFTDSIHIATAHNANDNAETILDHIMRGTGVKGLRGILPKRDIYIRPLLFASRKEIEQYANENALEFHTDSSNSDIKYRRNRIRHILVPQLAKQFNPKIITSLNRLGANMTEVNEYLDHEIAIKFHNCLKFKDEHKIILDINDYLAYFKILQKGILAHSLELLGVDARILDYALSEQVIQALQKQKNGYTFPLITGINMTIYNNVLVIWRSDTGMQPVNIPAKPGYYYFGDRTIFEIKKAEKPLNFKNKSRDTEWIDADKIVEPLVIRNVIAGDRFFPVNFSGSKKVSDYFIDEKIPVYERQQTPILVSKNGIVWLIGKRLDNRFKVTEKTTKIYQIQIRKAE